MLIEQRGVAVLQHTTVKHSYLTRSMQCVLYVFKDFPEYSRAHWDVKIEMF